MLRRISTRRTIDLQGGLGGHSPGEPQGRLARRVPQCTASVGTLALCQERGHPGRRGGIVCDQTIDPMSENLGHPILPRGDHRRSGRHRFQRGVGKGIEMRRKHKYVRGGVVRLRLRHRPHEPHPPVDPEGLHPAIPPGTPPPSHHRHAQPGVRRPRLRRRLQEQSESLTGEIPPTIRTATSSSWNSRARRVSARKLAAFSGVNRSGSTPLYTRRMRSAGKGYYRPGSRLDSAGNWR